MLINVVLLLVLVPVYGLIGGCVATVLSYMLEGMIMISVFKRISGIDSWWLLILQKEDVHYMWRTFCSLGVGLKQWFRGNAVESKD